jgi:hypothetical protein
VSGALAGIAVLVALVALVAAIVAIARNRSSGHEIGKPDRMSEEVVAGLMTELRKWQAEAAHWKAMAERLQRELDQR